MFRDRQTIHRQEGKMATATHTAAEILWSLSPAQRHKQERLYSGQQETVVLTVTVLNPMPPMGAVKVELRKNGVAVPNAKLRAWLEHGGETIN
jgi:hypothetical protein